jgi:hypothetical protein
MRERAFATGRPASPMGKTAAGGVMMRYCSTTLTFGGSFSVDDVDATKEAERELRLARVLLAFHHAAPSDFE